MYKVLKQLITTVKSLDKEEKLKYTRFLDNLSEGNIGDVETAKELNQYLEHEFTQLEDAAIKAEDAELINRLATLRNTRLKLEKQLLGITES